MIGSGKAATCWAWACIVAYLLTGLFPPGGSLVLCIGPDGHFGLETTADDAECSDCAPETPSVPKGCSTPLEVGLVPTGCTCSHIPLLSGASDANVVRTLVRVDQASPPPGPPRVIACPPPPPLRVPEPRWREQAPPRPRVPLLLTLRI